MSRTACILCGAFLDESDSVPHWLGNFRALFTDFEKWDDARLSEVARIEEFDEVTIPITDNVRVDELEPIVEGGHARIYLGRTVFDFRRRYPPPPPIIPESNWGFPVHACCWDLVCAFEPTMNRQPAVQALFDICMSNPVQMGAMNWAHDYGGLAKYDLPIDSLCPGEDTELWNYEVPVDSVYTHDPFTIPQIARLLEHDRFSPARHADFTVLSQGRGRDDPFQQLPHELLVEILVQLQSPDVVALRLSSRPFARLGLPDRFWRSRFWPGKELHHIFELRNAHLPQGCWRQVYRETKRLSTVPAVVNRRRIWGLISYVTNIVQTRIQNRSHEHLERMQPFDNETERKEVAGGMVHALHDRGFNKGSRPLFRKYITMSDPISAIRVSLVDLQGKAYIAGLCIGLQSGRSEELGYLGPAAVVEIGIPPDASEALAGIQTARDPRGFRGLRVLFRSGTWSPWAGDHLALSKQTFQTPASTPSVHEPFQLKAEFDAMKLVSMTFCGLHSEKVHMWVPEAPASGLVVQGLGEYVSSVPHSVCLFGGNDGQLVRHMTKITAYATDNSDTYEEGDRTKIWGLEFHYDAPFNGADSVLLGRIPGRKQHNPSSHEVHLESDKGEIITRIDNMSEHYNFIFGIVLHTSLGKRYELPPGCTDDMDGELMLEELTPPTGIITGVFTHQQTLLGRPPRDVVLTNVGIVCLPSAGATTEAEVVAP